MEPKVQRVSLSKKKKKKSPESYGSRKKIGIPSFFISPQSSEGVGIVFLRLSWMMVLGLTLGWRSKIISLITLRLCIQLAFLPFLMTLVI